MITRVRIGKGIAGVVTLALAMSLGVAPALAQYGPPAGAYEGRGWDAPPPEMREAMRQGYRDGVVGAQRDVENHRRPNVRNRDEFRHPNVPGNLRHDYREGFRRGYDVAMRHMLRGPRPY